MGTFNGLVKQLIKVYKCWTCWDDGHLRITDLALSEFVLEVPLTEFPKGIFPWD